MSKDRMPLIIMGRVIGTASGWDQVGDTMLYFYDVDTKGDLGFPAPFDMAFDYLTGAIELYGNVGQTVLTRVDGLDYLAQHGFDRHIE
jgi:hypothetical protein